MRLAGKIFRFLKTPFVPFIVLKTTVSIPRFQCKNRFEKRTTQAEIFEKKQNRVKAWFGVPCCANKLVINGDKTPMVVLGKRQEAARRQKVTISAGGHTITPSKSEKLLGAIISEDMKWTVNLVHSDMSLLSQLTSRINGLSKVTSRAPVTTRLMIANGIFMFKLVYLIHLWGNSSKYLLKSIQILQNRAAWVVTGYRVF